MSEEKNSESIEVKKSNLEKLIQIEKSDGTRKIIAFMDADLDDPNVDHWYALGDFIDKDGEWHEDGLPDGVVSYDPSRLLMVPVFNFEESK